MKHITTDCPYCGKHYTIYLPPFPIKEYSRCSACGGAFARIYDGQTLQLSTDVPKRFRL